VHGACTVHARLRLRLQPRLAGHVLQLQFVACHLEPVNVSQLQFIAGCLLPVNVLQLQFVVEPNLNHFSLSEDEVGMFAHFLRAALHHPEPSTDQQGGEARQR
jgi:hypothetical protein